MSAFTPPEFESVPAELRAYPRWVCWRQELISGRSKPTKIPYIAGGTGKASSTDASTWRSFDTAKQAYLRGTYDGIGYMFAEGDGKIFVDRDHCVDEDGNLTVETRALLSRLNTYAEYSPTDGIHAFALGALEGDWHRKGDTEIYWTERYSTITGRRIPGTPKTVNYVNGPLHELYDSLKPDDWHPKGSVDSTDPCRSLLTDEEVITKAAASSNGLKFTGLMAGDLFGYADDQSAADLALCGILAFWCGNDTAQMDRIFRTSKLMRPKWDSRRGRSTYGTDTLAKACGGEVYSPERHRRFVDPVTDSTASTNRRSGTAYEHPPPVGDGIDESSIRLLAELAAKEVRIAELEQRAAQLAVDLEIAQSLVDRFQVETPTDRIERLEQKLRRAEQQNREITAIAFDTAVNFSDRISTICTMVKADIFRTPMEMGAEKPEVSRVRIYVGRMEEEIGLAKGTLARHLKLPMERGYLTYETKKDGTDPTTGMPRTASFVTPGDGKLRPVADHRRERDRDAKREQSVKRKDELSKLHAQLSELQGATVRADADGCQCCGGALLPTGYYCDTCRVTYTPTQLAGRPVVKGLLGHRKSRPPAASTILRTYINTNMGDESSMPLGPPIASYPDALGYGPDGGRF